MSPLSLLLNVVWLVFGGLVMSLGWLLTSIVLAISIVGLPWARAAFNIASYVFLPFGREAVSRRDLTGRDDIGTGPLGFIGNLVWLVLAGWWLAIGHLIAAIATAITIIGLPLAIAHLKLIGISLWPIGVTIVDKD